MCRRGGDFYKNLNPQIINHRLTLKCHLNTSGSSQNANKPGVVTKTQYEVLMPSVGFLVRLKGILLSAKAFRVVFDLFWRTLKETTKASKDYFSFQRFPTKSYKLSQWYANKTTWQICPDSQTAHFLSFPHKDRYGRC